MNYIPKYGGICFRIDDNKPINNYLEYGSIFSKHGFNFCFALNLGRDEFNSTEFVTGVKQLQEAGNELMDHTPNHKTSSFYTKFDPASYIGVEGVDHIIGNSIYLEYEQVNIANASRSGHVNINGNAVTSDHYEFDEMGYYEVYLYFPELYQKPLVLVRKILDSGKLEITDAWMRDIDLGIYENTKYYSFTVSNVHLTYDALSLLASETSKLAELYDLEKPVTWIQPGVSKPYFFPYVYMEELNNSIGINNGYVSGSVYPYTYEKTYKVFNEYDKNNDKQFGMNWGDFNVDSEPLQDSKSIIANGIAKHHVLIASSHFTNLLGGWEAYLERVDSVLSWCKTNNIPVKTYRQWSDILYNEIPDPYQNIFPPLNIDHDKNNIPDGYEELNYCALDKFDSPIDPNNYSLSIERVGNMVEINDLAGIEKAENEFCIWTKGSPGNFIEVRFDFGWKEEIFKFPAESSEWHKFCLSESINGNTTLSFTEEQTFVDVSIRCSEFNSGIVKIAGMHLAKKKNLTDWNLDLSIYIEGAYTADKEMATTINSILPLTQPFNVDPWNYSGDETIMNSLNENIVDWILVSLYIDNNLPPITRRAGLLRNDGKIVDLDGNSPITLSAFPGNYFIKIQHRNHLPIMTAEKVPFFTTD
jgi:hypothetical protein